MSSFDDFKISTPLRKTIADLGFEHPRPIQTKSFPVILSGNDMVGIAQTGTGKTFAYMLPILQMLPFSKEKHPRALVLVPTRELVVQVVEEIEKFGKYTSLTTLGVYGGTNINSQKEALAEGADIIVATPGRLYDLMLSGSLRTKSIKKVVIDEVDVMLDLGFRFQLTNIMDLLPQRRQNIMFSATMTQEVDKLINDYFKAPRKITIAVSGTPLDNISQHCYAVPNFYTKVNLLVELFKDKNLFSKVLVFTLNKKTADRLFTEIDEFFGSEACIVHSNKTQNYRLRSIKQFEEGENRILITTDVMARGLDLDRISHVINFDTPIFPENYMHRIGRTGRAEEKGASLLFFTEKEKPAKEAIEDLMKHEIPQLKLPEAVEIATRLTPAETSKIKERDNPGKSSKDDERGASFHEKKDKNKRINQGGSYKRIIEKKYKKRKTKGDKNYNKRNKRK
ncbi:DEAD/DEAH box helicase [Maribacter algarum]|uniref:DEAD/DEAH box helicase n=1 Tax=Maribacter algarum (ex Zhang et al. 2020) TaxID=2578118 RepID=A0A5S3PRL4_9FLAO|nr:DEAD/DEAH box helicase [Maribacter algarum]TMM57324.1 DEAD/DEAH box helicase [Maribacter algarum]